MNKQLLESLFHDWARWVHQGGVSDSGHSIIAKLMATRGVLIRGSGHGGPVDCVEAEIEVALARINQQKPAAVTLFRLEYGAIRQPGFNPEQTQILKAHALGISVRTYKRRLSAVKNFIVEQLKEKRASHG